MPPVNISYASPMSYLHDKAVFQSFYQINSSDIIIPTSFAFDLSCLHTTDTAGTYWSSYDTTELKHNHNPLSAFLCFDLYELTKV